MGNDSYTLTDYQKCFSNYNTFINIINNKSQNYYEGYFVEKQKYDIFKTQYDALLNKEQQLTLQKQELEETVTELAS